MKIFLKFIKKINRNLLFTARIRSLVDLIYPHLTCSKNILDIGAGDGELVGALNEKMEQPVSFFAIDTIVQKSKHIKIEKFNGEKIDYEDNFFDCVILCDVLHHTNDLDELKLLLKEAIRVSRKKIIIKDHYYENGLDFYILKIADWIGNAPYGINLSYNFLKEKEWSDMMSGLNIRISYHRLFRYRFFSPTKHIFFKLTKYESNSSKKGI